MRRAEQANILNSGGAAERVWLPMFEREKAAFAAAAASSVYERALMLVAFPNNAGYFARNVTGAGLGEPAFAWFVSANSSLGFRGDERVEGAFEDCVEITRGDAVRQ